MPSSRRNAFSSSTFRLWGSRAMHHVAPLVSKSLRLGEAQIYSGHKNKGVATLKTVQIFFANRADGLKAGTPINVVVSTVSRRPLGS